MLVLKLVIPVACTYGEPLCDEVGAQFYLLIVFLMSGGRGRAMVFSYQSIPLGHYKKRHIRDILGRMDFFLSYI